MSYLQSIAHDSRNILNVRPAYPAAKPHQANSKAKHTQSNESTKKRERLFAVRGWCKQEQSEKQNNHAEPQCHEDLNKSRHTECTRQHSAITLSHEATSEKGDERIVQPRPVTMENNAISSDAADDRLKEQSAPYATNDIPGETVNSFLHRHPSGKTRFDGRI
jgi:hypothetical protein